MERIHNIHDELGIRQEVETYSGFDQLQYNEDNGHGLHFNYRPLAYYFEIGKLTIGI